MAAPCKALPPHLSDYLKLDCFHFHVSFTLTYLCPTFCLQSTNIQCFLMTGIEKKRVSGCSFFYQDPPISLPMNTMKCHINYTWIIVHFRVGGISGTSFISRLKIWRISCFIFYGQNIDSDSETGYHNSLSTEFQHKFSSLNC
jgi:hypothetical protein